jgi:DNA-binding transcriptional ArsR family regulator
MVDVEKLCKIFKVLSVDTRLKILLLLKEKVLCVGALARSLNISQAAVSQHLRIMRDAGILISDKRGYFVHYKLSDDVMDELSGMVRSLFGGEES